MANRGEASQLKGMSLKHAHEMRRHNAIITLQEQVRKLTIELKRIK